MIRNPKPSNAEPIDEEFEAMLAEHLPTAAPKHRGEMIDARVVSIEDDAVIFNYGSKEEVSVPKEEFTDPRGNITISPGASVRLVYDGFDEEENPKFSYKKARQAEAIVMLEQAFASKVPVRGIISRSVNGGLIVDVGLPAFMPASQVDIRRIEDMSSMLGQEIEAYVTDLRLEDRRAVLSRRKLLEERRDADRSKEMESLQAGQTIRGKVREVLDFGAFVDIGSVSGMMPRSEASYDRGSKLADLVRVGEEMDFKIVDIDRTSGRLTLSRKRLNEDPWTRAEENYAVGTTVRGKVAAIQPFGAFVQLEEGVTGLIHGKDVSWDTQRKDVAQLFKLGDEVTCQIIELDPAARRLALSLKHLARDPWLDVVDKYPVGSRHTGVISQVKDFGAFVKLDESTQALLHASDMTWGQRVNNMAEHAKEGDSVEVTVLSHDLEKRRLRVGRKQLSQSPFDQFISENPRGSVVKGTVTRIVPFGAFVELAPNLEGLVHISELDENRVDSPERVVRVGEVIDVKILETAADKQRISLSRKEAIRAEEDENIKAYTKSANELAGKSSIFGAALEKAQTRKK